MLEPENSAKNSLEEAFSYHIGLIAIDRNWRGITWWLNQQNNSTPSGAFAKETPPTSVKLTTLKPGIIKKVSEVVGIIEARDAVILKPEVEGRINQILVKEGDRMAKGQVIVKLDNGDWQAQLLEAQARLVSSQGRLAELEAGNRVEDIQETKARLREAKARLRNAEAGGSIEEIAQAEAQVNAAQATAELAQQRVAPVMKVLRHRGLFLRMNIKNIPQRLVVLWRILNKLNGVYLN